MLINNVKRIAFVEKNVAKLIDSTPIDTDKLGEHEVVVKNLISTISAGTEKANITGLRVGEAPVVFPRYSGYSNCCEVVAVGNGVTKFKKGDRAVTIWGTHANYHIMQEDNLVKVPDGISNEEAGIIFIGTFPIAGVRKVRLEIGENCAVIGLGILGQLAVQFARAAGAYPVIAVDVNKQRREEALKNGADYALDPSDPDYIKNAIAICPDGYVTAIEVTGVGEALNQTLRLMKKFGRIALLGCTRDSNFTVDYYARVHTPGVELIGAHTLARPTKESFPHYFTNEDDIKSIMGMCLGKRINLKDMVNETHSPEECEEVYTRLITEKNFPTVVQFNWSLLK